MSSSSPIAPVAALASAIHHLTIPNPDAKVFLFFGAGAGFASDAPDSLRLPSGNEIRDKLLEKRYPELPQNDRITRFISEYRTAVSTPDVVWSTLIAETYSNLPIYYPTLLSLFSKRKPVPRTYYMLARWFFLANNCGGIATTNFDEMVNAAFLSVARDFNFDIGDHFYIPSVERDYQYFQQGGVESKKLVQKLHGTLSMPWSIVAGIHTGGTREHSGPSHAPFRPEKVDENQDFIPYTSFRKALSEAAYWVFIGYSFNDENLAGVITDVFRDAPHKMVYIVDPCPNQKFIQKCSTVLGVQKSEVQAVTSTAEDFLATLVRSMKRTSLTKHIQLRETERAVLNAGPHAIYPGSQRLVSKHTTTGDSKFNDNVHGEFSFFPKLSDAIIDFIDTGEVQRLRNIKQLSFVNLKFPGATHDRFTHTLGVARLADSFMQLLRAGECAPKLPEKYKTEAEHLAFVVSAIIHDIGHGPLGHTMDSVRNWASIGGSHEMHSIALCLQARSSDDSFADFHHAFDDNPVSRTEIISILRKKDKVGKKHPLGLLLANDGLDIDRLDFIIRDSLHTIYSLIPITGLAEQQRALQIVAPASKRLLAGVEFIMEDGEYNIGYSKDVADIITNVGALYSFLYDKVYYCWQNTCAQSMIAMAISELLRSNKFDWGDLIRLTDVELFAALEEFENPLVQEMAYLVKYRRLFEFCYEARFEGVFPLSEPEFTQQIGIETTDRFKVLTAIRNQKTFDVRFVEKPDLFGDEILAPPTNLGKASGRVMIFRLPKCGIDLARHIERARAVLIEHGCRITAEAIAPN